MRLTKFVRVCVFGASLCMVGAPIANSASIYRTTFDYRKAEPAINQFQGKTSQQIAEHCKSKSLGTMELSRHAPSSSSSQPRQRSLRLSKLPKRKSSKTTWRSKEP